MIKKILHLLFFQEKKIASLLLIFVILMAFLDTLGIASIMPFVAILSNPQLIETNLFLNYFYQISSIVGVASVQDFLFLFGVLVFLLLVISISIRALVNYAQIKFSSMREYSISTRLIEGYLRQPYVSFIRQNSADLSKNILSEVNVVIKGVFIPTMTIITQCTVTIMLIILLFITNPILALNVSLVLIISYGTIFYFVKNIISLLGSSRLKANQDRFKIVSEAFGGIKEIKIGALEKFYSSRFKKSAKIFSNNLSLASIISTLPRYFLEVIAFGGMIILILVLMSRGSSFSNIIPIISLYAFAGYRLIPALQQIYSSFSTIRFSKTSFDTLYKDLINLEKFDTGAKQISAMPINKSITLKNVSFIYPGTRQKVLKNINLSISAFSKIGIVGTTGSGKTTMVDIILGLLNATEGSLRVDGNIINECNRLSLQKSIGYVPQQIYLSDNSIACNIAFGVDVTKIDYRRVEEVAKISSLHDFVTKELSNNYDTIIGERGIRLSGGQRQRIGIARALYNKPKLLVLDEATSALDSFTEATVMEGISSLGDEITIIMIAHRISTVKKCDNIILLEKGKLKAQGTYKDVFRHL
jgi:ABC-type bacteriocin/lantibiotic exporter with double-glycine peptidase domain